MYKRIHNYWPTLVVVLLYYLVVLVILLLSAPQTGNQLIYPLDDTYIHMAMAKNFAQNLVWGVTSYSFSSSTSSPLWTALLSVFYLFRSGYNILPLFLNLVLGTILVFYFFVRLLIKLNWAEKTSH